MENVKRAAISARPPRYYEFPLIVRLSDRDYFLSHKRIKVDIAFVLPGMYVAQLDRSWLESPFSAHGFKISSDNEMQLLRKFCKYIYVDVARSSVDQGKILDAHARKVSDPFGQAVNPANGSDSGGLASKISGVLGRLGIPGLGSASSNSGGRYQTKESAAKEAPAAAAAYDHAAAQLAEILVEVRANKGVNVDKLKDAVEPVIESILRNPDAMSLQCHIRSQSDNKFRLSVSKAVWAVTLGRHLGFDKPALFNLAMGGSLLDLGNAAIPESMVMGSQAPTEDEFEILRKHPIYGGKILRKSGGINEDILSMVIGHHERHDGSGYPGAISGDEITIYGQIGGLVACYDDMIKGKPYEPAKSPYEAIRELNNLSGTLFQASAVQHFVQVHGMFPTGSVVLINTGEVGIVVGQNTERRLRPDLLLVLGPQKQPLAETRSLSLSKVPEQINKRKARWIIKGYEAGAFDIDLKKFFSD